MAPKRLNLPCTFTIWTLSTLFSDRYYSELYWSVKPKAVSVVESIWRSSQSM